VKEKEDLNIFQIAHSILAAFFGVQAKKNFERDGEYLEKRGWGPYILVGIVMAVCLHLVIYTIVKSVVP
jgi:hypothetical protein